MPNSHGPHAQNSFRLLMFGGLSLVDGAGADLGQQRRRLALLALLAAGGKRGVSRDRLVAFLSPESPVESARHALEQLIYYLRRMLGPDVFLGSDPLRLNPEILGSDLFDFEEALTSQRLEEAVRLYRGAFLDGFHLGDSQEFEEWVGVERASLRGSYLAALTRLAKAHEERGAHDLAVALWRQLVVCDPLDGQAALGLMGALAAAGDRPGALRHASEHQLRVRSELGISSDPELARFAERLQRNGAPDVPPAPRRDPETERPGLPTEPAGGDAKRLGWPARVAGGLTVGVMVVVAALIGMAGGSDAPAPGMGLAATDQVLVSDFEAAPGDSLVARALTEALRGALSGTRLMQVVSRAELDQALLRMQRPVTTRLDRATTSELTIRNGYEAVLGGSISPLGTGYVLSANLVTTDGKEIARISEAVGSPDSLIVAVGRLSRSLRRSIGESALILDSVPPLQQVTTPSLRALELFTQAHDLLRAERGRAPVILGLLRQAVEMDSTFAMAHRQLGMIHMNRGAFRDAMTSLRAAERFSDRLMPVERLMAQSSLHFLLREFALAGDAAREILRREPYHAWAESQMSWQYLYSGRYWDAERDVLARQAVHPNPPAWFTNSNGPFWSWVKSYQGRGGEALDSARANYRHHAESVGSSSHREARSRLAIFHAVQFGYDSAEHWASASGTDDDGTLLVLVTSRLAQGLMASGFEANGVRTRGSEAARPAVGYSLRAEALAALTTAVLAEDRDAADRRLEAMLSDSGYRHTEPADRPVRLILALSLAGRAGDARREILEIERASDADMRAARAPDLALARGAVAMAESRWQDAIAAFRTAATGVSWDLEDGCRVCALPWLGRAYEGASRSDSAAAAYERYLTTGDPDRFVVDAVWRAATLRRLGELHAELGDTARALRRLSEFVELWKHADQELQPQVIQARRRMLQLGGKEEG